MCKMRQSRKEKIGLNSSTYIWKPRPVLTKQKVARRHFAHCTQRGLVPYQKVASVFVHVVYCSGQAGCHGANCGGKNTRGVPVNLYCPADLPPCVWGV